jgi:ABC-type ATPase involved in cell division
MTLLTIASTHASDWLHLGPLDRDGSARLVELFHHAQVNPRMLERIWRLARGSPGTRPRVLFADEPTSSLDAAAATGVLEVLGSALLDGTTVVLVTHDEAIVKRIGARPVRVADGRVL